MKPARAKIRLGTLFPYLPGVEMAVVERLEAPDAHLLVCQETGTSMTGRTGLRLLLTEADIRRRKTRTAR